MESLLKIFRSLEIKLVTSGHNENLCLFLWAKDFLHRVNVKLEDLLVRIAIHTGDQYRVVWASDGRVWMGGKYVGKLWPNSKD